MIVEVYGPKIFWKCVSTLKHQDDAKDANQEILIKVYNNISSFKWKSKLSTWIFSITRNHCLDILKKKKNYKQVPLDDGVLTITTIDDISYSTDKEENTIALYAALKLLKPADRDILVRRMKKQKIDEIAQSLSINPSAVKMRNKRAKLALLKVLKWN